MVEIVIVVGVPRIWQHIIYLVFYLVRLLKVKFLLSLSIYVFLLNQYQKRFQTVSES